jgi:hypothetical protein
VPAEVRHLIFSEDEILAAIGRFYRKIKEPLPPGDIIKLSVHDKPVVRAELEIGDDAEGERQQVRLEGERLAAALILHCKANRVPLPATAHKVLRAVEGRLVFIVFSGLTPEEAGWLGVRL